MMDLEKIYILHEGFSMILNFSCLQIKDEAYRMNLFFSYLARSTDLSTNFFNKLFSNSIYYTLYILFRNRLSAIIAFT